MVFGLWLSGSAAAASVMPDGWKAEAPAEHPCLLFGAADYPRIKAGLAAYGPHSEHGEEPLASALSGDEAAQRKATERWRKRWKEYSKRWSKETSSDFPNYDRNHNTAADPNADAELVTARQTVYHGGPQASRILLPVIAE